MAIKRITAANENTYTGRSRMEAQHYWAETHGRLVANSPTLRRYHHYFSLYEAYQNEPKPTFIGISMFWRDNPLNVPARSEADQDPFTHYYRNQPLGSDDRQVFDREKRWPTDDQHADILGEEHVLIDGETKASMVNAIFMVVRKPGLDHRDFFDHWLNVHGTTRGAATRAQALHSEPRRARELRLRHQHPRRLVRALVRRLLVVPAGHAVSRVGCHGSRRRDAILP